MEKTVAIKPDGTIVMVYEDDFFSGIPVKQSCKRISEVDFNPVTQRWNIRPLVGPNAGQILDIDFPRRDEAIRFEIAYLGNILEDFGDLI